MIKTAFAPLFVPGTHPHLLTKAKASAADAVVLDLEDAVSAERKSEARATLDESGFDAVRINDARSAWFEEDLKSISTAGVSAVMLPKTESAEELRMLSSRLPSGTVIVALVETVRGIKNVFEIAEACDRLAFGSLDYAQDMGCAAEHEPLLFGRSQVVAAAILAGQTAPLDGVTANFRDDEQCRQDTVHAVKMGFGGRLCIHPSQTAIVLDGFRPGEREVEWARKVLAAGPGVHNIDGKMVDAPVRLQAEKIYKRFEAASLSKLNKIEELHQGS